MTTTIFAITIIFSLLLVFIVMYFIYKYLYSKNSTLVEDAVIPFVIDINDSNVFFDREATFDLNDNYSEFFKMNRSVRLFFSVFNIDPKDEFVLEVINKDKHRRLMEFLPLEYDSFLNYGENNKSYKAKIKFYDYDDIKTKRLSGAILIEGLKIKQNSEEWLWTNLVINTSKSALSTYTRYITNRVNKRSFPYSIYMFDFSNYLSNQIYEYSLFNLNTFKNKLKNKKIIISNLSNNNLFLLSNKKYSNMRYKKYRQFIIKNIKNNLSDSNTEDFYTSIVSSSNLISKIEIKQKIEFAKFNLLVSKYMNNKEPIISDDRIKETHDLFFKYSTYDFRIDNRTKDFIKDNFKLEKFKIVDHKDHVLINYEYDKIITYVTQFMSEFNFNSIISNIINNETNNNIYLKISYSDIFDYMNYFEFPKFISIKKTSKKLIVIISQMDIIDFNNDLIKKFNDILKKNNIEMGVEIYDLSLKSVLIANSEFLSTVILDDHIFDFINNANISRNFSKDLMLLLNTRELFINDKYKKLLHKKIQANKNLRFIKDNDI